VEGEEEDETELAKKDLLLAFVLEMKGIERLRYLSQFSQLPMESILQCMEIIERCTLHSNELATSAFNSEYFVVWLIELLEKLERLDEQESLRSLPLNKDEESTLTIIEKGVDIIWILCVANKEVAKQILGNETVVKTLHRFLPIDSLPSAPSCRQSVSATAINLLHLQCLYQIRLPKSVIAYTRAAVDILESFYFPSIIQNEDVSLQLLHNMNVTLQFTISIFVSVLQRKETQQIELQERFSFLAPVIHTMCQQVCMKHQCVLSTEFQLMYECVLGNLFSLLLNMQKKALQYAIPLNIDLPQFNEHILSLMNLVIEDLTHSPCANVRTEVLFKNGSLVDWFYCDTTSHIAKSMRRRILVNFLMLSEVVGSNLSTTDQASNFLTPRNIELLEQIFCTCKQELQGVLDTLPANKRSLFLFQFRSICWLIHYSFSCLHRAHTKRLCDTFTVAKMYSYALDSCSFLYHGCEAFVSRLFVGWIFNKNVIQELLQDFQIPGQDNSELVESVLQLRNVYSHMILPTELLNYSEDLFAERSADSFFLRAEKSVLPLAKNWWLLPVKLWYDEAQAKPSDAPRRSTVSFFHPVLIFSLLVIQNLPPTALTAINRGNIVAEISKCFLLPGEVYLDPVVNSLLHRFLVIVGKEPIVYEQRVFSLMRDVASEYAATSMGEALFTNYLLVSLQMQQAPEFRKLIWELSSVLKFLHPHKSDSDVNAFLYPIESDSKIIQAIVAMKHNNGNWFVVNDFLHDVAVHHLAGTLFCDFVNCNTLSPWLRQQTFKQIPKQFRTEVFQYFPKDWNGDAKQAEEERRNHFEAE